MTVKRMARRMTTADTKNTWEQDVGNVSNETEVHISNKTLPFAGIDTCDLVGKNTEGVFLFFFQIDKDICNDASELLTFLGIIFLGHNYSLQTHFMTMNHNVLSCTLIVLVSVIVWGFFLEPLYYYHGSISFFYFCFCHIWLFKWQCHTITITKNVRVYVTGSGSIVSHSSNTEQY